MAPVTLHSVSGVRLAVLTTVVLTAGSPAICDSATASRDHREARIAFVANAQLHTARADGSGDRRLTGGERSFVTSPSWSPNGKRIAFARDQGIFDVRPNGKHPRLLVRRAPAQVSASAPNYSPDGRRIVFARITDTQTAFGEQVVIAKADGSSPRVIYRLPDSRSATNIDEATFSPDAKRLLLSESTLTRGHSSHLRFRRSLHSIPSTGGKATLVAGGAASPSFSPSGKRMAYVSEADHNGVTCQSLCDLHGEIYIADADGSHARRVTHTKRDEESPDWSGDGRHIIYSSGDRLYTTAVHEGCTTVPFRRLKPNGYSPDWEPEPNLRHLPAPAEAQVAAARRPRRLKS